MKIAVIEAGGKQYLVSEGTKVTTERIEGASVGKDISFDKVLLTDDGSALSLGAPHVKGAKISASYDEEGKGKKVLVVKYKAKSRYLKRRGHRQPYGKLTIKSL